MVPISTGDYLKKNTTVISNEERNLLFLLRRHKADFSPEKTGFEMTEQRVADNRRALPHRYPQLYPPPNPVDQGHTPIT